MQTDNRGEHTGGPIDITASLPPQGVCVSVYTV